MRLSQRLKISWVRFNTQTPLLARSHPEIDETELMVEEGHNASQRLIDNLQWLCCMGRTGIQFAVCYLSHVLACPRKKQLRVAKRVFQYLKYFLEQGIIIDHHDLECVPVLPVPDVSFEQQYPSSFKEIANIP